MKSSILETRLIFYRVVMEIITSLKDNSTKTKVKVCSLSIKRNNVSGITLKIKSQKFADFFKNNTTRLTGNTVYVNGLQVGESLRDSNIDSENVGYGHFTADTTYLRRDANTVNLSFLREQRIGEGVEFNIIGRYSVEAMNDFKVEFKKAVVDFYIENMQIVNIELDIVAMEAA